MEETLRSVLTQTVPASEIIVVDDGSTDRSAKIARSFGGPVHVIEQPNQGESVARNVGIDAANGSWIAFLDADDRFEANRLEAHFEVCKNDEIASHCNLYFFGDESGQTNFGLFDEGTRYEPESLCCKNIFLTPSAMIVRKDKCPSFADHIAHGEDLIFCLDLVQRGKIGFHPSPLVGYRKHSGAQSANAGTRIGWFETVSGWIRENQSLFKTKDINEIEAVWLGMLASDAWKFKNARNWRDDWRVRRFLEDHKGTPEVDTLLSNRIYHPLVYSVADRVKWPFRLASGAPRKRGSTYSS